MSDVSSTGHPIASFARVLRDEPPRSLVAWLVLTVAGSLTESFGLLLLLPLLELLQRAGDPPSASGVAGHLRAALQSLGLPLSAPVLLAVFVAMVGASAWLQYGRGIASSALQLRWVDRVRARAFAALMDSEYGWIVRQRQSDHVSLLINDINRVGVGLTSGLTVLAVLATSVVYLATALLLAPVLTLVVLALGGLAWRWLARQRREAIELGHAQGAGNRRLQARLQETLTGIKLAKILGAEERLKSGFADAVADLRHQQMRFQRSQGRSRALTQAAAAIFLAGFIEIGLSAWKTPLAELLVLVLLIARLIPMFSSAQQQMHVWLNSMPALAQIDALVRECESAAEPRLPASGGQASGHLQETIELRGATLRRAGRDAPTLADVSVSLRARTTTALIGPSGAGKTTLADVLAGLFPLDAGVMAVDGRPIAGPDRMRWRRSVAYVTQEVFLVHDTIRNNLRWGLAPGDAPDDAALAVVLRQAAAEFVLALPQGLDTLIGDGGLMLSGGERQRLALARALLRRPSLLILDEATSALDVDNEARIGAAIRALHGNVTVLLIGHRLATLQHADQVLAMKDGRIVHRGSWAAVRASMEEMS